MQYYGPITLAIAVSVAYHIVMKYTPGDLHPAVALIVTYGTAIVICALSLLVVKPEGGLLAELRKVNWASFVLAFVLVGLELAYILAYRVGWRVSVAGILVNAVMTVLLIPIGVGLFNEKITPANIAGIFICIVGLVLINLGQ